MDHEKPIQPQPYWHNITAGIGLGLVLLLAYYVSGRGLGGSGFIMRVTTAVLNQFSSEHVAKLSYLNGYFENGSIIWNDWLIMQFIGMFFGGLFGAITAGRFGKAIEKGPRITTGQRFFFAVLGGGIIGWAARLARGCTSGQALSGGATLALGSWVFMLALFAGGFIGGYFVRRLWL
ncbi:MAG: YeeE/YedE family protein [SAR324 cluster bacterium]|nr:YeeE/YedE family protein [SAR324 cluster bacterium]MBF0351888.1 YeeE/YedE family protein [SAR324 cluster bacterium]